MVETFLQSGQNVHVPVLERRFRETSNEWELSVIHIAAMAGHVQVVEILLSYGANKEMQSLASRRRPLHLAVEAGHVAMVRYLLDKGTDIAASDPGSGQAIHLATRCGSTEMLSLLLDRGAAIDSAMTNGDQPLHVASQHPDRANIIRLLCSQGADIEAKTHDGCTPLYYACLHKAVDNTEALLELGAEVDLQDSNGDTPLHCLCTHREKPMSEQEKLQLQLATILLRSTRDVDTVNLAGETALGLSLKKGESGKLSQSLIDSGARLLVSRPAIELHLELEHISGFLSFLKCHVRRNSTAWTEKRLGYWHQVDQDSLARLNSRSLGELRQLLWDQGIYNGSK